MFNYRHPGPRRGEPRVGSAPLVAFPVDPVHPLDPVDPLDPLDPLQNSPWAPMTVKKQYTGTFFPENEHHIFMEIQKSIFRPEKNIFWTRKCFLDQKMICLD